MMIEQQEDGSTPGLVVSERKPEAEKVEQDYFTKKEERAFRDAVLDVLQPRSHRRGIGENHRAAPSLALLTVLCYLLGARQSSVAAGLASQLSIRPCSLS